MHRHLAAGLTLAAAAAAATLSAPHPAWAAGDITIDPVPFVGTRSRADVRAELQQAGDVYRRDTEWGEQQSAAGVFKSAITPRQAREQYQAARDQVNALTREDSGSSYLKQHPEAVNPAAVMGAPAQ